MRDLLVQLIMMVAFNGLAHASDHRKQVESAVACYFDGRDALQKIDIISGAGEGLSEWQSRLEDPCPGCGSGISVQMSGAEDSVSGCSATRTGKRPWSSGISSLGLFMWNAPAATNRMWFVRT